MSNEAPDRIDPARHYKYATAGELIADGVSARQVDRWVRSGKLAYVQLPGSRVIKGSDLIAFLAARRVAAK